MNEKRTLVTDELRATKVRAPKELVASLGISKSSYEYKFFRAKTLFAPRSWK